MSPFEIMGLIREAVDAEREKHVRILRILERLIDEERAKNRDLCAVIREGRERNKVVAFRPAIAALGPVLDELDRATAKFPTWPNDPLHALAVLGEEFGELTKALLELTYEPHKANPSAARAEAVQTAAMALRLLISLDRYEYRRCAQHSQAALAMGAQ